MTETKWTPGPWLRDCRTIYALEHAGWRKGVEQFKNRFFASVQQTATTPEEEIEANAILIAAAPDLYAELACLRSLYATATYNHPDDSARIDALNRVDMVLAKARGEA